MIDLEEIKKKIALKALEFVRPGMKVGLGSGTTAAYFIKVLGQKVQEGLPIEAIAASLESEKLAQRYHIPLNPDLTLCDIYIDGTDEIDDAKNCLKGKGKALFREKIIASMSKTVLILADETKRSLVLHKSPLVIEILPFGYLSTIQHLEKLGFQGSIRLDEQHKKILTDNHNYLFDLILNSPIENPRKLHESLKAIPGVLETGLFFDLVNKALIGLKGGQIILFE